MAEANAELDKFAVARAKRDFEEAIAARNAALKTIRATQKAMASASELNRLLEAAAQNPSPAARTAIEGPYTYIREIGEQALRGGSRVGVRAVLGQPGPTRDPGQQGCDATIEDELTNKILRRTQAAVDDAIGKAKSISDKLINAF